MRNYDPKQVILAVGGNVIIGYADGTYISAERNEDAFALVVGADGETARARSQDRSGVVTLTLMQTSPSNDALTAFAALDELSGTGVVSLMMKDMLGTTLVAAQNAWVRKFPAVEFGKELTTREWAIECDFLAVFAGGGT